jgi:hypothetical protein
MGADIQGRTGAAEKNIAVMGSRRKRFATHEAKAIEYPILVWVILMLL